MLSGLVRRKENEAPNDPVLPALKRQLDEVTAARQRENATPRVPSPEAARLRAEIAARQAQLDQERQAKLDDINHKLADLDNAGNPETAKAALDAKIEQRRSELASMRPEVDPVGDQLREQIANLNNRLAEAEREQHAALTVKSPMLFSDPGRFKFNEVGMMPDMLPAPKPYEVPTEPGQSFGVNGPNIARLALPSSPANSPALAAPPAAQQVKVSGEAEILQTIKVEVNPAILNRIGNLEGKVNLTLHEGEVGHSMAGSNGVQAPTSTGLGHR